VRSLAPGQRFTPVEIPHPDTVYAPQVITQILHRIDDPTYETNSGAPNYENEFWVMPASVPATPHRLTARPHIDGLQIAVVAGPPGEEIHTDQYGRVKLTFPWDRRAKGDGTDTCWVRVGQPWAGTNWGAQIIPRVGMEVLIAYQEGDPDRPLLVGVVPNPVNPVPYDLPTNKTRMVFRSSSYKSSGNNEMTFEDRTGAENQFFHASKDQTDNVINNRTKSVGVNESNSIGQNQSTTVGQNATTEVGGSMNVSVGGTGAGSAAMMAPLLGMTGVTAGMLGQALQVSGGAAGDQPQMPSPD
jgi:type VI secretion system secreted protein VgrG